MRLPRLSAAVFSGLMIAAWAAAPPVCAGQAAATPRVQVPAVSDEADAVLAILAKRKLGRSITRADWQRLFSSEGYVRLKKREEAMKRSFTDEEFKKFVLSDGLLRRADALRATLGKWERADLTGAAARALAYLPAGARLRAKVYLVIKPQTNSFVFELETNPAIFLYLDPALDAAQFENTVAHELHHVGYAASCGPQSESPQFTSLPKNVRTVYEWATAFGEGFAMLAAAGGPNVNPHAESLPEERARWDRSMTHYNENLGRLDRFFLAIAEKRLTDPREIRKEGYSFFGIQGPWYTVGWKMAVTIERTYGRARLIGCLCDPLRFLETYNSAAAEQNRAGHARLALWSPELLRALEPPAAAKKR
jgi:Putative zinc dependent peptidase (DUF5700)